jgi:hypothetical protein
MSFNKLLWQMFGWPLVLLLLAGCGAQVGPTATPLPPTTTPTSVPPTATPTAVPTSTPGARLGQTAANQQLAA